MLDRFFKPKGKDVKSKYTLEQLMKLDALIKAFEGQENVELKMYKNIVDILGNPKLTKKDTDVIVKEFLDVLRETPTFVQKFEHNGVWYGFIPNLDKMLVEEYIDLDGYMKHGTDQAHRVMAILYRPITMEVGDLYQIEEYQGSDKYCKEMLSTPYHIYLSALVFFCGLGMSLKNYLNTYTLILKSLTPQNQPTDTQG